MTLVLVDLDGTLLVWPSSERLFITHLAMRGRLGPWQAWSAMAFLAHHLPRFGARAFKLDKAYLDGLDVVDVETLARRFVERTIVPRLRAAMLARLDGHRRAGDTLALLSGAPDFIVGPLAARLHIPHWRAARLVRAGGRFRAALPEVHPFAADKVATAEALAREARAPLAGATAYGNSIHDATLLERVHRPVAVDPDRRLRRLAQARGWEILGETPAAAAPTLSGHDFPLAG